MSGLTQGHRWARVFYCHLTGSPVNVSDLQALADAIAGAWNANDKTHANTSTTLTAVQIDYVTSTGGALSFTGTYSYTGTKSGTAIADAGACVVIDWVISDRYRGGHPRSYVPGLCDSDVSNGSDIAGNQQTNYVADATAMKTAVNAFTHGGITSCEMGTVRFQSGNQWLQPPVFVQFTSAKIGKKGKLGSQRRRILA